MQDHQYILLDSDVEQSDFNIFGLGFQRNSVRGSSAHGWTTVNSNTGYTVGHFVTHDDSFSYGNQIGLHLGQVDQLTFLSDTAKTIVGTFIDCRRNSETFGNRAELKFTASPYRKLIIPSGVAHSFSNISNVVTRNDLLLYSPSADASWSIEEDLVAMPLDIERHQLTPVEPYSLALPREAALMFYRLQTFLMRGGRGGDPGDTTISGEQRLRPKSDDCKIVRCAPNSFFPVASQSWGILPSTQSCEMELLIVDANPESASYSTLSKGTVFHTVLNNSGNKIEIDAIDGQGKIETYEFLCDERARLEMLGMHTCRYRARGQLIIRQEVEVQSALLSEGY